MSIPASNTAATASTHLMIVHPRYLPDLISGRKNLESRLGKDKRAPFGRVQPGDTVFIKPTGGPVCAVARVERVDEFEGLTPADITSMRDTYEDRILGGDNYWDAKSDAQFATLVWLTKVRPISDASSVPSDLLKPSRNAWRTTGPATPSTAKRAA